MSNPTHPSASPGVCRAQFFAPASDPRACPQRARLAVGASRERERRLRAQTLRFVSVCRRELLRRDAEPGRGK